MTNEQTIISLDLLSNFTKRKYVICSFDLVQNNQEKIKDFTSLSFSHLYNLKRISQDYFEKIILEFDDNFSLHFYDI